MAGLEPQVKRIRVPVSTWAIAYHIVRTGRDTFSHSELTDAACGSLEPAIADGLIERLDNGLYRANVELAKFYASLLPKAHVPERTGRWGSPLAPKGEKPSCEERQEALRLALAWQKLGKWAEAHAEDSEELPKDILSVLNKHDIEVLRMTLPSGAKAIIAKVLNYYIIMDRDMVKNSPKCVRFPQLGPGAMICASTREKLYWHLIPLALRPQN